MNKEPDEPQGGLPRHYLRAVLLLLIAESPVHGYDLLERIGDLGLHAGDPGGVYRALRGLERDGYVESWWEHSGSGPSRRTYRLSRTGAKGLDAWADALREAHHFVALYLDRYDEIRSDLRVTGRASSTSRSTVSG